MKLIKKILLIAGIVLLIGVLLCSVSLAVVNWDPAGLSTTQNVVSKTYQGAYDGLSEIHIGTNHVDVEVVPTTDPQITITYNEKELEPFQIVQENGSLQISEENGDQTADSADLGWFESIHLKMKIEIPERFSGSIYADAADINLKISKFQHLQELQCKSTSGAMELSDLNATVLSLTSDNSGIQITDTTATQKAEVTTSNGDVTARSLIAGSISLQTTNGKIYVDKIRSDTILLQTTNGRIRGYITGKEKDYAIHTETVQGKSNLTDRESQSGKTLEAYSVNGGIDLSFEEPPVPTTESTTMA